jgi:hypothetical protein
MSLPHTYNPVFTATSAPPPAGVEQITFPFSSVLAETSTQTCDVEVNLASNGTVNFSSIPINPDINPWVSGNSLIDSNWAASRSGGITGSDYEGRFNWSVASVHTAFQTPSATQNTWVSMGSGRTFSVSHFEATTNPRLGSSSLQIEIRIQSTGVIVLDRTITLNTSVNAP